MAVILRTVGVGGNHDPNSETGTTNERNRKALQAGMDFFINKNFVSDGDTGIIRIGTGLGTNGSWTMDIPVNGPTGCTADATFYLTIEGSAGMSFASSDPLVQNAARGVLVSASSEFAPVMNGAPSFTRWADIQVVNTFSAASGGSSGIGARSGETNWQFDRVMDFGGVNDGSSGNGILLRAPFTANFSVFRTCRIILLSGGNVALNNCTYIGNTSRRMFDEFCTFTVRNSICYNNGTADDYSIGSGTTFAGASSHNVSSDSSGPSTSLLANETITNVLENVTLGSEDLRTKAGAWRASGTSASAWTSNGDIRRAAVAATPDRGAWHFQSAIGRPPQRLIGYADSSAYYYGLG